LKLLEQSYSDDENNKALEKLANKVKME